MEEKIRRVFWLEVVVLVRGATGDWMVPPIEVASRRRWDALRVAEAWPIPCSWDRYLGQAPSAATVAAWVQSSRCGLAPGGEAAV